jgi:hypothetical protein
MMGQIMNEATGESLEEHVSRLSAELTTQSMVTDALVHLLCFDAGNLSGSKFLQVLDFMKDQLEAGLGHGSDLAVAFRDRHEGLRTMLIDGALNELAEPSH